MKLPNPDEITQLLAEFQSKRESMFKHLLPWRPLIEGLRKKGAAYDAIATILRQQGLDTNREQIRRFCREELDAPSRKKRQPKPRRLDARQTENEAASSSPIETPTVNPPAATENIQQTLEENRKQFLPGLPRRSGPRIANIKPSESK